MRYILVTFLFLVFGSKIFSCSLIRQAGMPYPNVLLYNRYSDILLAKVIGADSCYRSQVKVLEVLNGNSKKEDLITFYHRTKKKTHCTSSCDSYYYKDSIYIFYLNRNSSGMLTSHLGNPSHLKFSRYRVNDQSGERILELLRLFKNVKPDGLVRVMDNDSNKVCMGRLKSGKAVGKWFFYDSQGRLFMKGTMNGVIRKDIWWFYFYDQKYTKLRGYYENGNETGKWKYYDKNNNEIGYHIYNYFGRKKFIWY